MPSATYSTKQLSTFKVLVDGEVIPIVPNSLEVDIPGDAKVRAMNAGGGATQIVFGVNAETLIGGVKFDLPATAQNYDRVRRWKANMINGIASTISLVELDTQIPFQQMQLTKDTKLHAKADGNISLEWQGQYLG